MATIHHGDAALDALVTHLTAAMATASLAVPVYRGWGDEGDADRRGRPTARTFVNVIGSRTTEEPVRGFVHSTATGVKRIAVARWRMDGAQVDVVSDLRNDFGRVLPVVRAALHPAAGAHPRLRLTSTTYYGDVVSWRVLGTVPDPENGPDRGDWRASILIRGAGHVVVEQSNVALATVEIDGSVSGSDHTETITA